MEPKYMYVVILVLFCAMLGIAQKAKRAKVLPASRFCLLINSVSVLSLAGLIAGSYELAKSEIVFGVLIAVYSLCILILVLKRKRCQSRLL